MYLNEAGVNYPDLGKWRRVCRADHPSQSSESPGPTIELTAAHRYPLSPRGKLGELGDMRSNLLMFEELTHDIPSLRYGALWPSTLNQLLNRLEG